VVLWRACRAVESHVEAHIRSLGLCGSDFAVLEVLLHRGPLPVSAIGRKVLLTSGSITTAIDRLEAKGWVVRGSDPDDRRARVVRLTPAGRRFVEPSFADHVEVIDRAFAVLSSRERGRLVDLLRKLGHHAADTTPRQRGDDR
jgi:MarR family 2-MHQ and catechol resistance regulon transcriptional repressor